ncbi:J domain-containing protein [Brevundimonas sp.]|uniref:J domain-containing protein n=1 Tax=Brevundimonas sp. TaxID=1871086 RepID=UPI003564BF6E
MSLAWLALAAVAVWALIRLGRQTERDSGRRGRAHWRVAATLFAAVMIGCGVLLAFRSAWLPAVGLIGAGLWLTFASRHRPLPSRGEAMTDAEARSLLGVAADATPAQINAAWKRLMGRAHPDQGGTEGLASRLNAARDRLLGK